MEEKEEQPEVGHSRGGQRWFLDHLVAEVSQQHSSKAINSERERIK